MKGQTEADAHNTKSLWRRKYKEVKVSSLLHSKPGQPQHCPEAEQNIQHFTTGNSICGINGSRFSTKTAKRLTKNGFDSALRCNTGDNGELNGSIHNENQAKSIKSLELYLESEIAEKFKASQTSQSNLMQNEKDPFKNTIMDTAHKDQEDTSDLIQRHLFTFPTLRTNKSEEKLHTLASNKDVSETSHRVELKSKPKARKARIERRHTIIGASSIVEMKDIQDWISMSDNKPKKDQKLSKDDSEVFIAKTGIVRTKLAENKTCQNWNKKGEQNNSSSKDKEGKFVMHRFQQEKERKGSCSDFSNISEQETLQRHGQEIDRSRSDNCRVSEIRKEDLCLYVTNKPDESILTTGINNKSNCFLTPRRFKTKEQCITMQQSRSWNGDDFDANSSDHKSSSLQHNGNGIRHGDGTELAFIGDDDDFLLRNRMRASSKGGDSKYNTFLDLSNLNLDEEVDPSSDGSLESVVTSLSDPESDIEREEESASADYRNQSEDVSGIVSFILCRSLDKIDEEPKEEEEYMEEKESTSVLFEEESSGICDEDSQLTAGEEIVAEKPNQVQATDEHKNHSPGESNAYNHNDDAQGTVQLTKEVISNLNSGTGDEDAKLNISQEDVVAEKRIPVKATDENEKQSSKEPNAYNHNDDPVVFQELPVNGVAKRHDQPNSTEMTNNLPADTVDLSDSSETTPSLESDKFQSCTSDSTDEKEFNLADENMSKNPSSDANTLINGNRLVSARSKRMSMPCDVRKLLKSQTIDSDQSNLSPGEKSALRSGLKRLFQIAMSTVDGNNRPGPKVKDILNFIETKGIKLSDPRIRGTIKRIEKEPDGAEASLKLELFCRVCEPSFSFIRSVFLSQLTIPGFSVFKLRMSRIFENLQDILKNNQGDIATNGDSSSSYNAAMRKLRQGKSQISLSVCTVDGQRCSFGNAETPHPLNACAAVFNYCLACQQNGIETPSHFMGKREHEEDMNEFSLLPSEKVCSPFSKAGAIVTSSLLFREVEVESRLNLLHEFYRSIIGQELLCCDNLSYNYKRIYGHDEIGLAYFLSATQRLPKGTSPDLANVLDFHFQSTSSAMTSDACAIGGATLANGGVCCLTDKVVINAACVQHTLDVMRSYRPALSRRNDKEAQDIAATWNDHGSIMLIIPGVLAITCFVHCQSNDVIQKMVECLIKDLLSTFNFSVYKSLKDRRNAFFQRPSLP